MRITWINPARIERRNGSQTSDRACVRLRCIAPGAELSKRGHDVAAVSLYDWQQWAGDPAFYDRDVFVLGKAFGDVSLIIHRIHEAKGKVAIDICDNIFEPPEDRLKRFYEAILPLADGVVTSSDNLRMAVGSRMRQPLPIVTIPDCVEGNRLEPIFAPSSGVLKLLWFGYPNNLPLVYRSLPALAAIGRGLTVELSLVTAWDDKKRRAFERKLVGLETRLVEWSVAVMAKELADCDIVIIPSDDGPGRVSKSANRLITSLWAGRYAVAYPLPSYAAFASFAGVGEDLPRNILWALENRDGVVERIAAGQEFIASHYTSALIGGAWESFAKLLQS
jgi:hypothetical protein